MFLRPERINLGIAGFACTVFGFYFSSVMDKLGRSASLIGLGILFLGGGRVLERTRRRLIGAHAIGGNMKPAYRGIAITVLHCLLMLTVAGKYAWDRDRLLRAWANATPIDPNLPIRGRYVMLQLQIVPADRSTEWSTARLAAENGRLVGHPGRIGRPTRLAPQSRVVGA